MLIIYSYIGVVILAISDNSLDILNNIFLSCSKDLIKNLVEIICLFFFWLSLFFIAISHARWSLTCTSISLNNHRTLSTHTARLMSY